MAISVPAGALAGDVTLMIEPITNTAHGGIGTSYRVDPEGTTFAKPVTITFTAGRDELKHTGLEAVRMACQSSDGIWHVLKNTASDPATQTISTEATHLSSWSPVSGVWLFPKDTKVKVNGSVEYWVESCFRYENPDDPLDYVPLGYPCSREAALLTLRGYDWAVEGVVGGDGEHGTLGMKSGTLTNTYIAPAKPPRGEVAIVSVRLGPMLPKSTRPNMIVQSIVSIEDEECPGAAATEYAGSCDEYPYCTNYYVKTGTALPANVPQDCSGSNGTWKTAPCGQTAWSCTGTRFQYKQVTYLRDKTLASGFRKNCLANPCTTSSQ